MRRWANGWLFEKNRGAKGFTMNYVNKYLRNLKPYKLASHTIWTASAEEKKKILKLDWNEATIPPSPKVRERLRKKIDEADFFNIYPSTCNVELLQRLSDYTGLPVENIQYFASSDSIHEYVAKLFISVGDPVLLVGPTYDNFRLTAEVCGARVFYYNVDNDFNFDIDGFYAQLEKIKPSMVYICNPNNPTGTVHTVRFLEETIKKFEDTLFLVDEAYAEFSGISAKELVLDNENIIISRTMSKAFALANFRIGYMLASKSNIDYISNIRNPKNISTLTQEAAIGALNDLEYMRAFVEEVRRAKECFSASLEKWDSYLSFAKGEGNFLLILTKQDGMKEKLFEYFKERGIYVRDVAQTEYLRKYGLRITIGTREQMRFVSDVIDQFFESWQRAETH